MEKRAENVKILHIQWGICGTADIDEAFVAEGHKVVRFPFSKDQDVVYNLEVEKELTDALHREIPDVVYSFNFFRSFLRFVRERISDISRGCLMIPVSFYIRKQSSTPATVFIFLTKNCACNFKKRASLQYTICRWLPIQSVWI